VRTSVGQHFVIGGKPQGLFTVLMADADHFPTIPFSDEPKDAVGLSIMAQDVVIRPDGFDGDYGSPPIIPP